MKKILFIKSSLVFFTTLLSIPAIMYGLEAKDREMVSQKHVNEMRNKMNEGIIPEFMGDVIQLSAGTKVRVIQAIGGKTTGVPLSFKLGVTLCGAITIEPIQNDKNVKLISYVKGKEAYTQRFNQGFYAIYPFEKEIGKIFLKKPITVKYDNGAYSRIFQPANHYYEIHCFEGNMPVACQSVVKIQSVTHNVLCSPAGKKQKASFSPLNMNKSRHKKAEEKDMRK